ncbi:MAG: DsbA family oxidoreductase [Bacteroidia bacterium]|jgi:protein disulfide-isomerase|nr:DsbA family oxidoreductase [Bacteroidia bacterium]
MKIEIWSDVMCPFCYIGKRNFEKALAQFPDSDKLEIVWKSFLLDPSVPDIATESYEDYLVKRKGLSAEQVRGMLKNVTQMASEAGLDYHFERAVMVSSQKAHQLIQFAKSRNLGNEAEERLFYAYFTEGKSIADHDTLIQLGVEIGLDAAELQAAFTDEQYAYQVSQDIQEARNIGVNGVPFFVFNRKYAISGAQPPQAFLETLRKSFGEWQKLNPQPKLDIQQGNSCTIDGVCE